MPGATLSGKRSDHAGWDLPLQAIETSWSGYAEPDAHARVHSCVWMGGGVSRPALRCAMPAIARWKHAAYNVWGAAATLRCACSMSASFLARLSSQSCAAGGSAMLSRRSGGQGAHSRHIGGTIPARHIGGTIPAHRGHSHSRHIEVTVTPGASCARVKRRMQYVRQRESRASLRRRHVARRCNMVMLHVGATW